MSRKIVFRKDKVNVFYSIKLDEDILVKYLSIDKDTTDFDKDGEYTERVKIIDAKITNFNLGLFLHENLKCSVADDDSLNIVKESLFLELKSINFVDHFSYKIKEHTEFDDRLVIIPREIPDLMDAVIEKLQSLGYKTNFDNCF